ncbi:Exc2 family lipoprotein [Klebsiella variicola]
MASIRSLTLILPLLLAACSGTQTSVERNASRAVSAINRIHFDPNTRMLRADSINSLKPMMQELGLCPEPA